MASSPFSLRLEDGVRDDLDFLAKATKRSKSSLAAEVLETHISARVTRLKEIQTAKKEADKGVFISHSDMKDWAHSLGSDNKLPKPTASRTAGK